MLSNLYLNNFVLAENLLLDFLDGLSVITGETGAGKSVVIGAISLILGARAEASFIKSGASQADIVATFEIENLSEIKNILEQQGIDSSECVIKRTLDKKGRSKNFLNGQIVPLSLLKQIGEEMLSFHGQHHHQKLLQGDFQRNLLDQYAQSSELNQQLNQCVYEWKTSRQKLDDLLAQQEENQQKSDFLNFQFKELDDFAVDEEEYRELETAQKQLANARALISALQQLNQLLNSEASEGVQSLLNRGIHVIQEFSGVDQQMSSFVEQLDSIDVQLGEILHDVNDYLSQLHEDPQQLEQVEQRLSGYFDLGRKYRCAPETLPLKKQEIEQQLELLSGSDKQIQEYQHQLKQYQCQYHDMVKKLSAQRKKAALQLAKEVEQIIHDLGMPLAQFQIELATKEADNSLPLNGLENIAFKVAANPGQAAENIAKVASGGELSRIALAINVVTSRFNRTPILIFDEVDVGVGGKIAEMIGMLLAKLSANAQIICVTHQPQVAIHGQQHFVANKVFTQQNTFLEVAAIENETRVDEIVRMLAGSEVTDLTKSHARELLEKVNTRA